MNRLFFIAKNNMKKQKGDMITFFILTFIAAFLILDCAQALLGLGNVLDDRFEEVNGAHFMIINTDTEAENDAAERAFKENEHIIAYECTPMLYFRTDYKNKNENEYLEYLFLIESFDQEKELMKINEAGSSFGKNDILLPLNMKGRFPIGDTLQLKAEDKVYEFNVAGYLEDPYFCSTINITLYSVCMSPEMMEELSEIESAGLRKASCHKGRIAADYRNGSYDTTQLEADITESYKEYLSEYAEKGVDVNLASYMSVNWDMMRGGAQFMPMMVMAIMLIFAGLIMLIALVIISFSIKNFIQKNMKNTGIMEASGYTVRELRLSLILQIVLVAFGGSLLGMIVAAVSFGTFGDMISSILGLSWNQPLNSAAALLSMLFLILVVASVAALESRSYKKVSVLDALRGGINTHNFRKNRFSFEKTPLPVPLVLALKDFTGGLGRNIRMILISMILVIAVLIGFGLVENFGEDPQGLIKIMAFEAGDASVTGNTGGDISEELRALPGTDKVLVQIGFEPTLSYGDHKDMLFTYAVDDLHNARNTNLLEGRLPEKENEILVTAGIAQDMELQTGDVVTLGYAGKEADYLVTGINQRVERMGRTIYMRLDGAQKLIPGDLSNMYSYGIYAKEGVDFESLSEQLNELKAEKGLSFNIQNDSLFMETTMKTVSDSLSLICLAIALLTILIVVFVESLVIRAKIGREWRNMGISKAMGQTSAGLISQIMLSNIPAVATGALLGVLLSSPVGSFSVKAAFSLFVVKNVCFDISAFWGVICFAGIIVTAILASAAAGLRVRKLRPVALIAED